MFFFFYRPLLPDRRNRSQANCSCTCPRPGLQNKRHRSLKSVRVSGWGWKCPKISIFDRPCFHKLRHRGEVGAHIDIFVSLGLCVVWNVKLYSAHPKTERSNYFPSNHILRRFKDILISTVELQRTIFSLQSTWLQIYSNVTAGLPFYSASARSVLTLTTNTTTQQGIHKHQTPPRYRNAATAGPSHGHRGSAQQISWRSVQQFQRYARGQTDTRTDNLIAILRSTTGAE